MSNLAKQKAAERALSFVREGMLIGLGSGSTSEVFVQRLGEKCQMGFKILGLATSRATEKLAKRWKIPLLDANQVSRLDIAVDGADEIAPNRMLIKGRGGALFREKIVASMSDQMVVIAESSKLVSKLGQFPLPLEVVPFGHLATLKKMQEMGHQATLRTLPNKEPFLTDQNYYIYDLRMPDKIADPKKLHAQLLEIPGVIETGLFLNLATHLCIGYPNGECKIL